MNGYQRITSVLRGEEPDTVPVMLHNFMMAAREAGMTMEQFRNDPGEMARAILTRTSSSAGTAISHLLPFPASSAASSHG